MINKTTVEYEPTSQPEIYRPPARDNFKNSGGTPAEQPAVKDEEPQILENTPSDAENHESIPKNSRNPETSQETLTQNPPKTPENNPESDAQDTEVIITRGEKYNLRPNPNPNYSDSYRY